MTDDEILQLLDNKKQYTREDIEALAYASTHEERTFVVRALGRLKRWGKVIKNEDGLYQATGTTTASMKLSTKPCAENNARSIPAPTPQKLKGLPLKDALLKTQALLKGRGVDELEDKLYALKFLGQLLDPTIDELFKSIAGDLERLHGEKSK